MKYEGCLWIVWRLAREMYDGCVMRDVFCGSWQQGCGATRTATRTNDATRIHVLVISTVTILWLHFNTWATRHLYMYSLVMTIFIYPPCFYIFYWSWLYLLIHHNCLHVFIHPWWSYELHGIIHAIRPHSPWQVFSHFKAPCHPVFITTIILTIHSLLLAS